MSNDPPPSGLGLPASIAQGLLNRAGILSEDTKSKLKTLRKTTIAINFLSAIKNNNEAGVNDLINHREIARQNSKFRTSGEVFQLALENNNESLVMSLKQQGFEVPDRLLLDFISAKNEFSIKTLVKFSLYSKNHLQAYYWYLLSQGFAEIAHDLASFHQELRQFEANSQKSIKIVLKNEELTETALTQAFELKCDELAEKLILSNESLINYNLISTALNSDCVKALRLIWIHRSKDKSYTKSTFNASSDNFYDESLKANGKISSFIQYYLSSQDYPRAKQVSLWPEAATESGILSLLINEQLSELAKDFVKTHKFKSPAKEFFEAFDTEQYELCVVMLELGVKHLILSNRKFQEKLVELVKSYHTCFHAVEILAKIGDSDWTSDLTKPLCDNLAFTLKKTDEIIFCPKPLLFCVLAAEYLQTLSGHLYEHSIRCNTLAEQFISLAVNFQKQIKGEEDLSFFLLHEDTQGRSTLSIVAENGFSQILEDDDVGTLVEKLWSGSREVHSIFEASSVYNSFVVGSNSLEAADFMKKMEDGRSYTFQFEQWKESCNLRYLGQVVSSALLVILYQVLIYRTFELDSLRDIASHDNTSGILKFVQAWIFGIAAEMILESFFIYFANRTNYISFWKVLDVCIFIMMLLVSEELTGSLSDKGFSDFDNDNFIQGILLSILMALIWTKFFGLLTITKNLGSFIRMICLMIIETVIFFVIFFAMFICAAGVFTAVFSNSNPSFVSFDYSLQYVFSAAMGGFDLTTYEKHKALGGAFEAFYLMMSNVVLLNLLVAVISNVYETLVNRVEGQYRNVIIEYTEKFVWDENYGFLIFLPSPFSSFLLFTIPLSFLVKDTKRLNEIMCKVLYVIYAVPLFLIFLLIQLAYLVPLYFKGFLIFNRVRKGLISTSEYVETYIVDDNIDSSNNGSRSVLKGILWFFIGIPVILWAICRDSYHFISILYSSPVENAKDTPDRAEKFDTLINSTFINTIQDTLQSIQPEVLDFKDFIAAWTLFDQVVNNESSTERLFEIEEFFKQFKMSSKENSINIEYMKKLLPRSKGGLYDDDYINRVRYLNPNSLMKGMKKFHSNIGALNISGLSIPQRKVQSEFDMERVNKLNLNIKQLEEKFQRLAGYSSRILDKCMIPKEV